MLESLETRALLTASNPVFVSAFSIAAIGVGSTIHSNAVTTDVTGDTFLTGSFKGSASFDPSSPSTTVSTSGTQDGFVAEYSPTGTLDWVKTFAGTSASSAVTQGSALATDAAGDVFVAGSFLGSVAFGGSNLTSTGQTEAYIAKLSPTGTVAWVTAVTGTTGAADGATALALDSTGLPIIAGNFQGSATFGSHTVTAGGSTDAFVAKLDSLGNFTWSEATHGSAGAVSLIHGLAVDASGDPIAVGQITGSVNFDPGLSNTTISSALLAASDATVWKLSPTGGFSFVNNYGGLLGTTAATAVAVDSSGDIFTTGGFTGTVNLNLGSLVGSLLNTSGVNGFVMKLSPSGVEDWADGLVGSTGTASGSGIAVDPSSGNVNVGGLFSGSIDFDPVGALLNTLTSAASTDIFAAGFDPAGDLLYDLPAGSTSNNGVSGVTVDPSGIVSMTGAYTGPISFGTTTLPATGVANDYVSKIFTSAAIPATPSAPVLTVGSQTGTSTTITANTAPVFNVATAASMDTVELLRNGSEVASRVGPGLIQDPGIVPQGTYTYTTIQVSPLNVASSPSTGTTLTIDTTPPLAPTGLGLLSTDDPGLPGFTNVTLPHLTGMSVAGDTVELFNGATMIGSAVAGSGGAFSIVPTTPLTAGVYTLTAEAVDQAGNVSAASLPYLMTLIVTPPAAPTGLGLLSSDDTGQPGYSNITLPHLTGSSVAGDTVELFNGSTEIGSSVAVSGGGFSIVPTTPLTQGTYYLTAKALDAAGNLSASSASYVLNIITTPPAAPSIPSLLPSEVTGAPGSNITNVVKPQFVGTGVAGIMVEIVDTSNNNAVIGGAVVASNGMFTVPTTTALANGVHVLKAEAMDAAGNLSTPSGSLSITVDSVTLSQLTPPSLLPADNTNITGGGTTVTRPRLIGTALAGARVDWLTSTGVVIASATASSNGSYTIQAPNSFANGTDQVYVRETDSAGNVSPLSNPFSLVIRVATGDYNGDGSTDLDVYNPTTETFSIRVNQSTTLTKQWGIAGDVPVQGDFFGDGRTDFAVFRPSTDTFYVYDQATGAIMTKQWGTAGDLPVMGDFFGDGRTDFAVFRPSTDTFFVYDQATNAIMVKQWGGSGDVPVVGDYFGDGKTDFAVYRPSDETFFVNDPANGAVMTKQWGAAGDVPVPGDYFGDGRTDFAVFRPSTDTFYVNDPANGAYLANQWGGAGDEPIPGDYDGDGKTDYAVYRPSTSTFYVVNSGTNTYYGAQFGTPNIEDAVMVPVAISLDFINSNGGTGAPAAQSAHGNGTVGEDDDMAIEDPDDTSDSSQTLSATAAHDRALYWLDLERWRFEA